MIKSLKNMSNDQASSIKEITQNKLVFVLNEVDKTAEIKGNDKAGTDVFIPRAIQYDAKEYIVTKILKNCFLDSKIIKSIQIPPDSELKTIENCSFSFSTVEKITIPSSVQELMDGWCANTSQLSKITIMPNNHHYTFFDEKMIIGKTDLQSDDYDILVFVCRNIDDIIIPSFIKIIASYAFSETLIKNIYIPPLVTKICEGAFYNCNLLQEVEFSMESQLQIIEKDAFSKTSIESISIPSSVSELKTGWCSNVPKLKTITIMSNNEKIDPKEEKESAIKDNSKQAEDTKLASSIVQYEDIQNLYCEKLFNEIQCPICYLAMLPPLRTPMIFPDCGHTFCEACISKLKKCPLCHHSITKPIKNILALQLIDSFDHKQSIPIEINPPPPAENKLIPKIDPICTFAASGEKFISQKSYQCKTCNIVENKIFCEICAKKCHNGHDIYLHENDENNENISYCDCFAFGKCNCLRETSNLRCTCELTYGVPVEQPMYQCEDCHAIKSFYICQNCAIKCHHGHNLHYIGIVKDKICNCFDQCECQISSRKPICICVKNGPTYIYQPYYNCKTCGDENGFKCCSACAHYCHKGHDVEFCDYSGQFFCDCGDGYHDAHCSILNKSNESYMTTCPNFAFENKDSKVEQRKYYCYTCGIFDSLGICEGCAINCHINHLIKYVGIEKFSCSCQTTNNCKMMMVPILHNDRDRCDRKVLGKDDVSACYTCYTCNKSGQMKICETCALKNHIDHDIHIIGYMKFDCYG